MELTVPTNWDDQLITRVKDAPVKEFFGKLPSDYFGGGRPSLYIPSVRKKVVGRHIDLIHRHGRTFNYLLNASCLDNAEFTRKGRARMHAFLDWLVGNGIDGVTVSVPFLVHWIKRHYPKLRIRVSIIADIEVRLDSKFGNYKFIKKTGCDNCLVSLFTLPAAIERQAGR